MPMLEKYSEFAGVHWETGTVRNALAYQGIKAPHTGKPYSEALLLGVSGGIVFGYFFFHYQGHAPLVSLLTRNTFDPWDTMLKRLGVVQHVLHTNSADKARTNLLNTLENGDVPIVWADSYSLPYNRLPEDDGMWAMQPIVVFGCEDDTVHIADRAAVPLHVTADELAAARAVVKKDKFRIITLEAPNPEKLASAVQKGIWDSIKLYTEKPPKGSKNNFGFAAYKRWANLLTKSKAKQSWAQFFPAGEAFYNGLVTAFTMGLLYGKGDTYQAERDLFADFLDEAAFILEKPALHDTAPLFRKSGAAWQTLGERLLPDSAPLLGETRRLLMQKHHHFLHGTGSADERAAIDQRLREIRAVMKEDFPLSAAEMKAIQEGIAEQVLVIHDVEQEAISTLQATGVEVHSTSRAK